MVSRSDRMYKDSPTLKRDADGKLGVTKAEKKAAEVNAGTDGIEGTDKGELFDRMRADLAETVDKYIGEIKTLYDGKGDASAGKNKKTKEDK